MNASNSPAGERLTPEVLAGQAVYTRRLLRAYDLIVLGISNRFIWRCPTPRLLRHYNAHITANHLDVGVGTGWFLDRCRFPSPNPRIVLMDLNPNTLEFAAHRIARYRPEICQRNVLEPIACEGGRFDSLGINYLFHCLPGPITEKAVAIDHLKPLMNPGAVVFGSTLLHGGVRRNLAARCLMRFYNEKGVFSNRADTLDGLRSALGDRLRDVQIDVIGCAAIFSGRV